MSIVHVLPAATIVVSLTLTTPWLQNRVNVVKFQKQNTHVLRQNCVHIHESNVCIRSQVRRERPFQLHEDTIIPYFSNAHETASPLQAFHLEFESKYFADVPSSCES